MYVQGVIWRTSLIKTDLKNYNRLDANKKPIKDQKIDHIMK